MLLAVLVGLMKRLDNMPAGNPEAATACSNEGKRSTSVRFRWLCELRQSRLSIDCGNDCERGTKACRIFFQRIADGILHGFTLFQRTGNWPFDTN